ncbi:sporulation initiation phosphotransferase F [mine drainage metagenome]|uniref:Sporulation initiation phosphotransferase F n=1 Tax=mine drainage metagenome TaxID=410659 RepID=A0A1J5PWM9_9ZZZZ
MCGKSVLLVDDEELTRYAIRLLLENLGHKVYEVAGGAEALEFLRKQRRPDLIVLDHNMPNMTGAQTLRQLRLEGQDLPVLLATGHLDLETEKLLKGDLRTCYIGKPFVLDELNRAIGTLLLMS